MDAFGTRRGSYYDEKWRLAVRDLYEEAFPGLPAGIDAAAAVGSRWADATTPFALFDGERCVCHVGVISHPMRLLGRTIGVAGVHAVCTAVEYRRQGLCRQTLGRALQWADARHDVAKLHTDAPEVYTGHGFVARPTWWFRSCVGPRGGAQKRPLRPLASDEDAALLRRLLARRRPVSARCASADEGWLVSIVACLSGLIESAMWWLPDHEAVVAIDDGEGESRVVEVIAERLPPSDVVRAVAANPERPLVWTFSPDLIDPSAEPFPAPGHTGTFMVRGAWPTGLTHFGISPLWAH